MEDIAGIITQFASYLSIVIEYIKSFLEMFKKKDEPKTDDAAEE